MLRYGGYIVFSHHFYINCSHFATERNEYSELSMKYVRTQRMEAVNLYVFVIELFAAFSLLIWWMNDKS